MGEQPLFEMTTRGAERREAGRLKQQLQNYSVILAIVSLVFTGGYNWRRVDELATTVKADSENTVKKDVQAEQFKLVTAQLESMQRQLNDLKDDVKTVLQGQRR